MGNEMDLRQALKEKWYVQGHNGAPLLLISAANSGFTMKKKLGYSYSAFLYLFKDDYCEMHYLVKDLDRIVSILIKNIKKDPKYLYKIKTGYNKQVFNLNKLFQKLDNLNLKKVYNQDLFDLLKESIQSVDISVSLAHIIEPFSLTMDFKIKQELSKYISKSNELTNKFTILMSPVKRSFVNEAEDLLSKVNNKNKDIIIKGYLKKFCWIRNSYAGRYNLKKKELLEEAKSLKEKKQIDFGKIKKQKKEIIKELSLNKEFISNIRTVEFMTAWQDERKKNILISLDYLELLLGELSHRFNINIRLLRYLKKEEIGPKLCSLRKELEKRKNGSIYFCLPKKTEVNTGRIYEKAKIRLSKSYDVGVKELTGITASSGTAIGIVKVCIGINSLKNVDKGDILVASMTRPEFVPAMKKASAIITDEGGITSHAAIVSRELGIPCIIGTKKATKVLKNGDLVEVKGNHGLITILKRA